MSEDWLCCDDFRWMVKQGFYIEAGRYYIINEAKSESGSGTSFVVRFCPHCGEGEMFTGGIEHPKYTKI